MDRTAFQTPPRWWGPMLSPFWMRLWRPLRKVYREKVQRLREVEVRQTEPLRQALADGKGVLITPNHSGHADALIMYAAADELGSPFYFMAAWQVLGLSSPLRRLIFRQHGCFSVDREGSDLQAFKHAVHILQHEPHPLVIFPEGEVYHINQRVTPFREGPAAMALAAARRSEREIVCVPCGICYSYVEDPTPDLCTLMDRVEEALYWRPRPDLPLPERIYRVAEGMLALKELEYLGSAQSGPVPQRVQHLADSILTRLEERHGSDGNGRVIPERVKQIRQKAIRLLEQSAEGSDERRQAIDDLEDVYLVIQLFSYPGDYVAENPCVERLAETLDKFEEDILRRQTATVRGTRRAVVTFGEPIPIDGRGPRDTAGLTRLLEQRVQELV